MENSILLYRIYDIAEEISLDRVEEHLGRIKPTSRLRLSRVRPKSIHINNPPVTVELGEENMNLDGSAYKALHTAKIFHLGVISLMVKILLPREYDYEAVHRLAVYLYNADEELESIFARLLNNLLPVLGDAVVKPALSDIVEDYTIYYFRNWDLKQDPIPLLLAETEPLSPQVCRELLANSFSYGIDDLTVITWDSALVYDASGSPDIPDLLEFANSQLLELRYYDNLLSHEMESMYQAIEFAESTSRIWRRSHYRKLMNRLMEVVADVSEITERIHNSLKVTEDIFYARVYGSALNIFRTKVWADNIERKISTIQQSYSMLSGEISTQQSALLEIAIIFLIALEIVLALTTLRN